MSGWPAYEWTRREHELVRSLAHRFSATSEEIPQRVDTLISQNKKLEKELKAAASQSARVSGASSWAVKLRAKR